MTRRCKLSRISKGLLFCAFVFVFAPPALIRAQAPSSITGTVLDPSGAPVVSTKVSAKNLETGGVRTVSTNLAGRYEILSLPVGRYEIKATKPGFADSLRTGIELSIGQEARIDFLLRLGSVSSEIRVTGDAPMVSTATKDISGLVGEQQVKELPLNGRSYDLLLPLNPGIVNFTSQKTGGTGISNSSTGNNFAVSGNRPQQNLFLLNGIEFTGAAENNMQPGGTSGMLLGVEAVREFNVQRDSYGAEFGKHPGAQVLIATRSGTNQWHGMAFEFLRNSAFDAPNFFDQGVAPPFQRSQFGASLGGPLRNGKTFLFTISEVFSTPLQTVREDFGTSRIDHVFSPNDSLAAIYTVDDGDDFTATPFDPFSADIVALREQVLSLEETHLFSSACLHTARVGFSRAGYFFTGKPTPGTPAASVPAFLLDRKSTRLNSSH